MKKAQIPHGMLAEAFVLVLFFFGLDEKGTDNSAQNVGSVCIAIVFFGLGKTKTEKFAATSWWVFYFLLVWTKMKKGQIRHGMLVAAFVLLLFFLAWAKPKQKKFAATSWWVFYFCWSGPK